MLGPGALKRFSRLLWLADCNQDPVRRHDTKLKHQDRLGTLRGVPERKMHSSRETDTPATSTDLSPRPRSSGVALPRRSGCTGGIPAIELRPPSPRGGVLPNSDPEVGGATTAVSPRRGGGRHHCPCKGRGSRRSSGQSASQSPLGWLGRQTTLRTTWLNQLQRERPRPGGQSLTFLGPCPERGQLAELEARGKARPCPPGRKARDARTRAPFTLLPAGPQAACGRGPGRQHWRQKHRVLRAPGHGL